VLVSAFEVCDYLLLCWNQYNLIAIYFTAVERSKAILFCDVYCYIINLYMTIVMIVWFVETSAYVKPFPVVLLTEHKNTLGYLYTGINILIPGLHFVISCCCRSSIQTSSCRGGRPEDNTYRKKARTLGAQYNNFYTVFQVL